MTAEYDFSGRTILVTGAASGIGEATSRWLAGHGAAHLVLVDINEPALIPNDLRCAVQTFVGDVGDPALWEQVEREAPSLNHAVLNAGVSSASAVADISFDEWRRVMRTNLDGAFLSLRAALRKAIDGGSIVLTSSVSGTKAEAGTAAYGASKAAVMQLARVAAKEAAPRRIRVNAIAPGGVDTPIWDEIPFFKGLVSHHGGDRSAALAAMAGAATPLGRFATADETAAQIGFLLSDAAATMTGAVLIADGGYSL
jgi:NAD(P)-dependent dehydrogenase (short-subunit alcohol dehydrogenase family)